jgi:hypothetical protein
MLKEISRTSPFFEWDRNALKWDLGDTGTREKPCGTGLGPTGPTRSHLVS